MAREKKFNDILVFYKLDKRDEKTKKSAEKLLHRILHEIYPDKEWDALTEEEKTYFKLVDVQEKMIKNYYTKKQISSDKLKERIREELVKFSKEAKDQLLYNRDMKNIFKESYKENMSDARKKESYEEFIRILKRFFSITQPELPVNYPSFKDWKDFNEVLLKEYLLNKSLPKDQQKCIHFYRPYDFIKDFEYKFDEIYVKEQKKHQAYREKYIKKLEEQKEKYKANFDESAEALKKYNLTLESSSEPLVKEYFPEVLSYDDVSEQEIDHEIIKLLLIVVKEKLGAVIDTEFIRYQLHKEKEYAKEKEIIQG